LTAKPSVPGSLYWAKSGWRARIVVEIDGERVKKAFDLGTSNKSAARLKLKRLLDSTEAPSEAEAKRTETFHEAALRIVDASKIASKANRLGRLRNHVYGHIGDKPVDTITASDVRAVLVAVVDQGLSRIW
jgi:hypothetical protein